MRTPYVHSSEPTPPTDTQNYNTAVLAIYHKVHQKLTATAAGNMHTNGLVAWLRWP
jgi:hypothetical protein